MIIPSKYLREDETLLGVGAALLKSLNTQKDLSSLWEELKDNSAIGTFERFVLALDLLFLLGLIEAHDNEIVRTVP